MDTSKLPLPKPKHRPRTTTRNRSRVRVAIGTARAECVERDGPCRVAKAIAEADNVLIQNDLVMAFGECQGRSEWSHYNATHRRSKTVNQDPEERHTSAHSLMLCTYHGAEYDQHRMDITELEPAGCHGRLRFQTAEYTWEE